MDNQPQHRKFWKLALAEITAPVAASAVLFYFLTTPMLAAPPPESGDLYAYNWSFQLIVFLVVWLPVTLLVAGSLVAIQYQALKSRYRSQQARGRGSVA